MGFRILAYVDPGTGGLVLQFILGGAAGLFAFFRYRWKSIKDRIGTSAEVVTDPTPDE